MDGAGGDLAGDLGCGKERDLDSGDVRNPRPVAPPFTGLDKVEAGGSEAAGRIGLEPALRGDGEDEGRGHGRGSDAVEPDREADRRNRDRGLVAEPGDERDQAVVASAADDRPDGLPRPIHLEHEAGVVVEPPTEIGGEGEAIESDVRARLKAASRASKRSTALPIASRSSRASARSAAAAALGGPAMSRRCASTAAGRAPTPAASAAFSAKRAAISSGVRPVTPRPVAANIASTLRRMRAGLAPASAPSSATATAPPSAARAISARSRAGIAEGAGEPPLPGRVEVERIEHRGEEAGVADPHHRPWDPEEGCGIEGEAEHVGVGRVAVGAAERLDAGLEELVGLVGTLPEDRAEIGVAGVPPRWPCGEVVERDGDGEVRPERHLDAVLVGGEEEAAAKVLAEELDEHPGVVDDRRLDEGVTFVGEKRAKRLIGLGHWDSPVTRTSSPLIPAHAAVNKSGGVSPP